MKIKLIFNITDDITLLPQFLSYYAFLGVDEFLLNVTDTVGDAGILDVCEHFLKHYPHQIANIYSGRHLWTKQMEMAKIAQEKFCRGEDWVLHVDLDEFHVYPDELRPFLIACGHSGSNLITGEVVDRVSSTGELLPLEPDLSVFDQFPLACRLSLEVLQVPRWRTVAVKGDVFISKQWDTEHDWLLQKGVESGKIQLHPAAIQVHYFKWHEKIVKKINERKSFYRQLFSKGDRQFEHVEESERMLEYFRKNRNRINLEKLEVYEPSLFEKPVSALTTLRFKNSIK